jgi:hypothetical protein
MIKRQLLSRSRPGLRFLSILVIAVPGCLWGQGSTGADARQAACEKAKAGLKAGARADEVRHAIVESQICPDLALTSLVEMWDRPPADSVALRLLGEVSGGTSDRDLFAKISQVAASTGTTTEVRLAAFRALAAYAVPGTTLLYRELDKPGLHGSAYVWTGASTERGENRGRVPLTAADRRQALDVLAEIGRTDGNVLVKAIAEQLAKRLSSAS